MVSLLSRLSSREETLPALCLLASHKQRQSVLLSAIRSEPHVKLSWLPLYNKQALSSNIHLPVWTFWRIPGSYLDDLAAHIWIATPNGMIICPIRKTTRLERRHSVMALGLANKRRHMASLYSKSHRVDLLLESRSEITAVAYLH